MKIQQNIQNLISNKSIEVVGKNDQKKISGGRMPQFVIDQLMAMGKCPPPTTDDF